MGPSGGNSHVTTRVMGTYGYAAPEYVATGEWLLPHIRSTDRTPSLSLPGDMPKFILSYFVWSGNKIFDGLKGLPRLYEFIFVVEFCLKCLLTYLNFELN